MLQAEKAWSGPGPHSGTRGGPSADSNEDPQSRTIFTTAQSYSSQRTSPDKALERRLVSSEGCASFSPSSCFHGWPSAWLGLRATSRVEDSGRLGLGTLSTLRHPFPSPRAENTAFSLALCPLSVGGVKREVRSSSCSRESNSFICHSPCSLKWLQCKITTKMFSSLSHLPPGTSWDFQFAFPWQDKQNWVFFEAYVPPSVLTLLAQKAVKAC